MDTVADLFGNQFMPHGMCYLWQPGILWTHVVADAVIALSYFALPGALLIIYRNKRGLEFRAALLGFIAFIVACGATHLMNIWVIWNPDYGVQGAMKTATAAVSLATAIAIWPLVPRILAQPSLRELTEAHRKSERSRKQFQGAFDSASHGIALVSTTGEWIRVNAALCAIVGYTEEELLAIDFQTITHADDLDRDLHHVEACLRGEIDRYQLEKRYLRKDGSEVNVLLSVAMIRDLQGEPVHFVSQIVDMTPLKLAESRLLQAQKQDVVGQLTGGVAHDFNNLLSVVLGNLEMAQRRIRRGVDAEKQVGRAVEAVNKGIHLNKQLLAYSRQQTLEEKTLDPNDFLPKLSVLLRPALGEEVDLRLLLEPDLWSARLDHHQLEHAILNLAVNARDAVTGKGQIEIAARNQPVDRYYAEVEGIETGHYLLITVSDNGPGISPEIKDKVLEPFFTTKPVGEGSGLGLSMVFGFVKQSRGHVQIYSEEGLGTSVRLYLPRENQPSKSVVGLEPTLRASGRQVILVVEDDERMRTLTSEQLEDLGYQVVRANSGEAAVEALGREEQIDLVFTDIVMPGGMDGVELAMQLRRDRPEVPVILASGYPPSQIGARGISWDVLPKPYTMAELARLIGHHLSSPHMRTPLSTIEGNSERSRP